MATLLIGALSELAEAYTKYRETATLFKNFESNGPKMIVVVPYAIQPFTKKARFETEAEFATAAASLFKRVDAFVERMRAHNDGGGGGGDGLPEEEGEKRLLEEAAGKLEATKKTVAGKFAKVVCGGIYASSGMGSLSSIPKVVLKANERPIWK